MFLDIQQTIRRNSTNVSHLMSELCTFKCLKLYSLNFAIAHAQIKMLCLSKLVIIVLHKKHTKNWFITWNKLNKSISNLSNL